MDTDPLEEQGGLGATVDGGIVGSPGIHDGGLAEAEEPMAETPRPGGWQRLAAKMGYVPTPELLQRVDARRRQRRSDGLARQIRLDAPAEPTSSDVTDLMNKMDEVMDMMLETRRRRNVSAPPRPDGPPPTSPKPLPGNRLGKGGVQLP